MFQIHHIFHATFDLHSRIMPVLASLLLCSKLLCQHGVPSYRGFGEQAEASAGLRSEHAASHNLAIVMAFLVWIVQTLRSYDGL